jgi:L,D-peptidoglycan transpeptidase YkuD (ErfK/YbiS/YcfS/YnhG family)
MGRRTGSRTASVASVASVAAVLAFGGALLAGCGGQAHDEAAKAAGPAGRAAGDASDRRQPAPDTGTTTLPGVGPALSARVPAATRQAVVVHGAGPDSPDATVTLFTRSGGRWLRGPSWPAHNGSRGWTTRHHENDRRSPVGVFTLHDAGGVRADPGSRLPYHHSASFTPPASWPAGYRHDFDYVIAIDYNRVVGTSPNDPTRPQGQSHGGGIWLHLDHGSGSSACVTLPEAGMRYLLRTLDPASHPVVVMGDGADLAG